MNYILGSLLSPLLYLPGLVMRFLPFKKLAHKKQKTALTVFYAFSLVLHMAVWYFWGMRHGSLDISFLKADMILFPLVTMLINCIFIKGRIKEHLFTYGIVMLFEYMNMTLTLLLSNIISKTDLGINPFALYIAFYSVFQLAFIPLTFKLLNMTVTPFLQFEDSEYWNTICFVPSAMVLVCYFTVYGEETISTLPPVIGRLFLMVCAIIICINLAKDHLRMTEQLEMKKALNMQKEYYEELSDQVARARRARHDMKHRLAVIQQFIDSNDKDGLQAYCYDYASFGLSDAIPYTGNSAADGVLYHYSEKAKAKDISFEIKGIIKSKSIDDTDLCVLLGNALDNAFSACEKINEKKFISVISETDEFMLSIIVVNSFDGIVEKKGEKILSRKEKDRHGVGLDSMKKVAEKYGGTMEISYDESTFKVIFILPSEQ